MRYSFKYMKVYIVSKIKQFMENKDFAIYSLIKQLGDKNRR